VASRKGYLTPFSPLVNGVHRLARGEFPRITKRARARKVLPWLSRMVLAAFYLALTAALAIMAGRLWFRLI